MEITAFSSMCRQLLIFQQGVKTEDNIITLTY
jgi:hypothetical protein